MAPLVLRHLWRFVVFVAFQFHPRPARRTDPAAYGYLWKLARLYERTRSR